MIAITGATGRIGRNVAAALTAAEVPAVALVRDPRSAGLPLPAVKADFRDPVALAGAMDGCSRLFLLTPHGPDQDLWERTAVKAAKTAGIDGIVKLSGGGPTLGPNGVTSTATAHWRSERLIEDEGFDFAHLRPSFLMDNLLGTVVPALTSTGLFVSPFSDEPIAMVDGRDVAACAVSLLEMKELGRTGFSATGPAAVSHREIAELLGLRSIRIPERIAAKAMARRGEGPWEIDHALRMITYFKTGAAGAAGDAVSRITGGAPRSITDFLRDHEGDFGPLREGRTKRLAFRARKPLLAEGTT